MKKFSDIRDKKVLVTGSSGFLGQHLCKKLVQLDAVVTGIDSVATDSGNQSMRESYSRCDIRDDDQVKKILEKGFDLIFHLAAIASPRTCKINFDLAYDVNVLGTKNIVSNSKDAGRLVFMSSASVYGNPIELPIREDHPLNGSDPYSITKIMGEFICHNYVDNYDYNISIARNFNAFGIGQPAEYIVPTLITQALKGGKIEIWNSNPVRDLMYVDDTINGLLAIGLNDGNGIYNIGSGVGTKIGALAQCIRESIGSQIKIVDLRKEVIGSSNLISDNTKLKTLGWEQEVGFDSGLSRTIDWFKTQ